MVRIGVLGGIGPEATGEFYLKLITKLQESRLIKSNPDYPQIIINSVPAAEVDPESWNKPVPFERLDPAYLNGLKELDRIGVDFISMVCNTVHLYYDTFQAAIRTPIIDLREEMKKHLIEKAIRSFLILGTPWTIMMGLYKFQGIREFRPNQDEIKQLYDAICNFSRGFEKDKQIQTSKRICEKYIADGAEVAILGCTEFAVMLDGADIPTVNSIDVLVKATFDRFCDAKVAR
jgi:aspartate racemase